MLSDRELYERKRRDIEAAAASGAASVFLSWPRERVMPDDLRAWLMADGWHVVSRLTLQASRDKQGVFIKRR